MTAYVLQAIMSQPDPNLDTAKEIANWLSKQQNPYGGYSSTQVTDKKCVHDVVHQWPSVGRATSCRRDKWLQNPQTVSGLIKISCLKHTIVLACS